MQFGSESLRRFLGKKYINDGGYHLKVENVPENTLGKSSGACVNDLRPPAPLSLSSAQSTILKPCFQFFFNVIVDNNYSKAPKIIHVVVG